MKEIEKIDYSRWQEQGKLSPFAKIVFDKLNELIDAINELKGEK
jgi:hypothetical protein